MNKAAKYMQLAEDALRQSVDFRRDQPHANIMSLAGMALLEAQVYALLAQAHATAELVDTLRVTGSKLR